MRDSPMPEQIKIYPSTEAAIEAKPHATLLITDRIIEPVEEVLLENGVIYRPNRWCLVWAAIVLLLLKKSNMSLMKHLHN